MGVILPRLYGALSPEAAAVSSEGPAAALTRDSSVSVLPCEV